MNPFQRTYVAQVRKCDEAERRLRFLTTQIVAQNIPIRPYDDTISQMAGRSGPQALEELDNRLAESEARVGAMNTSYETLEKRALELEEARQVLRETDVFFKDATGRREEIRESFDEPNAPLLGDVEEGRTGDDSGLGGFELESVSPSSLAYLTAHSRARSDSLLELSIEVEWLLSSEFSGEFSVVIST